MLYMAQNTKLPKIKISMTLSPENLVVINRERGNKTLSKAIDDILTNVIKKDKEKGATGEVAV